jgi:hypothetical protein
MKSEEEFDDLFKDKLSESSGHYSPENWERMQLLLNASHGAKGAFIWSRLNNMVAVVGVGVGAFVGSQLFIVESTQSKLDFTKTISKEISKGGETIQGLGIENEIALASNTESGTVKDESSYSLSVAQKQNLSGNKNNYALGANRNIINNQFETAQAKTNASQDLQNPLAATASTSSLQENIGSVGTNTLNNGTTAGNNEVIASTTTEETAKIIVDENITESAKEIVAQENIGIEKNPETSLDENIVDAKPEKIVLEATQTNQPEELTKEEVEKPIASVEESPAAITDPIITANKVIPVNFGFEGGMQFHNQWGANASDKIATGYVVGANFRVNLKPKLSLTSQLNFAYRAGVNLPKTSYVYAYDFNLVRIPITVNVNGFASSTLLVGARYSLGKLGSLQANVGGQFIMDTHASVSSTVDTIPLPSGNWGYRTGLKRWDWMASIGYDYSFCNHFEAFANYHYGFNKDNTDDQYFGTNSIDVNRYLQVGLRYFIKPSVSNVTERFK